MWLVVKYEVEIFGKSHAEKVGVGGNIWSDVFPCLFKWILHNDLKDGGIYYTEVCQLDIVPKNKQIYKVNKKFREYYYWVY